MKLDPCLTICPVFSHPRVNGKRHFRFCGTGSFITHNSTQFFLTVNHVIAEQPELTIGIPEKNAANVAHLDGRVCVCSAELDLALLQIEGFVCPTPLMINTSNVPYNEPVFCQEYSRSGLRPDQKFEMAPSTRVGNVVRYVNIDGYPSHSLELSFPAVRGASGAPVVTQYEKFAVCGVMIANVSYELLPVQTISVTDSINGTVIDEKTDFYLPQALAVNSIHVLELLQRVK